MRYNLICMNNVLIENEQLCIRKLEPSMSFDVWKNSLDENNRRFVPDEVFETLEDAQEVVNQLINRYESEDGPFVYALFRKEDSANIGYVQLVKIDDGWEIGYHVAIAYNGCGYATNAVQLFLEYLKQNASIKQIYGIALADNKASLRVLEKNGFEMIFKGQGLYQGKEREIVKTIKTL